MDRAGCVESGENQSGDEDRYLESSTVQVKIDDRCTFHQRVTDIERTESGTDSTKTNRKQSETTENERPIDF